MGGHFDERIRTWRSAVRGNDCCKPHYAVKADGDAAQVVPELLEAIHANAANASSIGIEHDGLGNNPDDYSEALYARSARLTREICLRRTIPIDRTHIIGHDEAPGTRHGDPGGFWDWDYYMALVGWDGNAATRPVRIVVDTTSPTFAKIGSAWTVERMARATDSGGQPMPPHPEHAWGSQVVTSPPEASFNDVAVFFAVAPVAGDYEVSLWWPVRATQSTAAAIGVYRGLPGPTSALLMGRWVDQSTRTGRVRATLALPNTPVWFSFGRVTLNALDVVGVAVWRASPQRGLIVADAVRLLKR
jgi:hypothetical protein